MILLFVVLTLTLPVQAVPPATDEPIVVVGQRLRELDIAVKTDRRTGAYYCRFRRRTSDAAFDALMCRYVLDCANSVEKWKQLRGCVEPKVAAYVRALHVDGRGGAK